MKTLKRILKRFCYKLYRLACEYEEEQVRRSFNIPRSVSVYKVGIGGNVSLGEHTYINEGSRIDSGVRSKVLIGQYCSIGRFVHITSKTHDLSRPTTDENNPHIKHVEADVVIGDYVWIGDKVTILPGVSIGDYAVIGAHSLVTRNVKPFEVVGGTPATHIKFNTVHYLYSNAGRNVC